MEYIVSFSITRQSGKTIDDCREVLSIIQRFKPFETSTNLPTEFDDCYHLIPQNTDGYYCKVSAAFMGRWDRAPFFELVQSS
jgi:hypothetical protein